MNVGKHNIEVRERGRGTAGKRVFRGIDGLDRAWAGFVAAVYFFGSLAWKARGSSGHGWRG